MDRLPTVLILLGLTLTVLCMAGVSSGAPLGLDGHSVKALAIDPKIRDTIYAGLSNGVVAKSVNGGADWILVDTEQTSDPYTALAISPGATNVVFAAGYKVGFWELAKSVDGGHAWTGPYEDCDDEGYGFCSVSGLTDIIVDPGGVLYAGAKSGQLGMSGRSVGVFKSYDGGVNWVATLMPGSLKVYMALDPVTSSTIYATGWGSGVYKSVDRGFSWEAMNTGLGSLSNNAIVIDPNDPSIIYVGSSGGEVYKSTNGGGDWTAMNEGLGIYAIDSMAIDPITPSTLYVGGASNGQLYKTKNGGATWFLSNLGMDENRYNIIMDLVVDPANPSIVYAATYDGVYRSDDYGATWVTPPPPRDLEVEVLDPDPNPDNSKVMEGGIAYRYYHVIYGPQAGEDAGKSVGDVKPTLEINGEKVVGEEPSDEFGLLTLAVDTAGIAVAGDVVTVKLVKLDERELEEEDQIEFQVEVTPRGYETYWDSGMKISGKFGLSAGGNGYVKGEREAGMSVVLKEPDPSASTKDEVVMTRRNSAAAGVGGGVESPGAKFNIGGVFHGKAIVQANAEVMAGLIMEDEYSFKSPYLPSQQMGQTALYLHQMTRLGRESDPFFGRLITLLMEATTEEYYTNYQTSQMLGLNVQASGSAGGGLTLGFGFGPKGTPEEKLMGLNIGGNAGVTISASGQHLMYYDGQTLIGTGMALDQFVDLHLNNFVIQAGIFFDKENEHGGSLGRQWKPLEDWNIEVVKRFVEKLRWDAAGNLVEIELSIVGKKEKQTYIVRGDENIQAVKEVAMNLKNLALALSDPFLAVTIGPEEIKQELKKFLTEAAKVKIEYEIVRTPPEPITIPFTFEVSAEIKVGAGINLTWNRHVDALAEKGVIIKGWELPLEKYKTHPTSGASLDTITKNLMSGVWEIVKDKFGHSVHDLLGGVEHIIDATGSTGSRIRLIVKMMETGQIDIWTWVNMVGDLLESSEAVTSGDVQYVRALQLGASPIIGANYQFMPEGAQLAEPGVLEIEYSDEEVQGYGVDEADLRISWWDPENSHWVGLESVVDATNNTVTASVTELHLFAITFDATSPVIDQLTPIPDSTVNMKDLVIRAHIEDDMDQLDGSSIVLLLDGQKAIYSFEDGWLIHAPADISLGEHTATIRASDLFGNAAEEIWSFTVTIFGDINLGGDVDGDDYAVFAAAWMTQSGEPNWNPNCDLHSDGAINFPDLVVLTENWLVGK